MKKNGLRKLKRVELLEKLIEIAEKNEQLIAENQRLRNELENRKIEVQAAGSIAEAALQINGVFTAAQEAADQYLLNIKRLNWELVAEKNAMGRQVMPATQGISEDDHCKPDSH